MESKDRDESRTRQREETLARRVGEALDRLHSDGAGACPDAGVIAAYSDEALDAKEAAQWEGHFAACARCRKILRVLAAASEAPLAEQEVAELGDRVAALRAPVDIAEARAEAARSRVIKQRARWLAPALGVAAVLAVWFAMRPPWRATGPGDSTTLVAQAPPNEITPSAAPAASDRLSTNAAPQEQKSDAAPSPERSSAKTAPLVSSAEALAKRQADAGSAAATGALDETKKAKSMPEEREMKIPADAPAPPAAKQAQAAAPAAPQPQSAIASTSRAAATLQSRINSNAEQNAPSPDAQAGANAARSETLQKDSSANLPLNGRAYEALKAVRPVEPSSILLMAKSGLILWRPGKGGAIERSKDAGKTWAIQVSPSPEDWLAGAAVSETVCWLAGRNGALARTTDGQRWERISPPLKAAGTGGNLPDWTHILARSAQKATITASDGRKFATADAGKTWQPQ